MIFVEDSTRNIPLGRVLKVDGFQCLVHFPSIGGAGGSTKAKDGSSENSENSSTPTALLDRTQILSRDNLTLVKQGALPRAPECFQVLYGARLEPRGLY